MDIHSVITLTTLDDDRGQGYVSLHVCEPNFRCVVGFRFLVDVLSPRAVFSVYDDSRWILLGQFSDSRICLFGDDDGDEVLPFLDSQRLVISTVFRLAQFGVSHWLDHIPHAGECSSTRRRMEAPVTFMLNEAEATRRFVESMLMLARYQAEKRCLV